LAKHRCGKGERGSSVVTFAILAPVVVFMMLGIVQLAVVSHVRHVASLAASAGAAEAAAFNGTSASGEARAQAQLNQASGWVVSTTAPVGIRGPESATMTINVTALKVLPFGSWQVTVQRTRPVERDQA